MCLTAVAHASFAAARMLAHVAAPHQAPRTEPRGPASSATLQQRLVLLALFTCTGSLYVQTCFPPLARSKCGSEGTRARGRDGWPFRAASHSCISHRIGPHGAAAATMLLLRLAVQASVAGQLCTECFASQEHILCDTQHESQPTVAQPFMCPAGAASQGLHIREQAAPRHDSTALYQTVPAHVLANCSGQRRRGTATQRLVHA